MPDRRQSIAIVWAALTFASLCVAGYVAIDTVRTIVSLHSPLPWLDDWNSVNLYRDWTRGDLSAPSALFSQFGEHRPLIPRLVFFADDLYFRGQGWLALGGTLLVQAGHVALFAVVLSRVPARDPGRWAVAGLVVALMFSLKQAANFASSFQLQFVGVFAAATLAFVLFGRVAAQAEAGVPVGATLTASLAAAAVSTFCMANGLICGVVLVVLGFAARLSARIVAVCAFASLVLAVIYFQGYHPASDHTPMSEALRQPLALALYAASYLGSLAGDANPVGAAILGFVGAAATAAAAVVVVILRPSPRAGLPLLGVMLFCGATALVTATGRLDFGVGQALEQRYVTAGATFWSAQLCFWWIAAPARLPRVLLAGLGVWLAVVLVGAQPGAKPALSRQKFNQDDAADLLLLGLEDPAVILRSAWDVANVREDSRFMRDAALSVFGDPDADLVGRSLATTGRIAPSASCTGGIDAAVSDARLGRDGVRVDGRGWNDALHRRPHRIVLIDRSDTIVGLAVSGNPGGIPRGWQGFAVAPVGSVLTAYGMIDAGGICRLGGPHVVAEQ